MTTRRFPLHTHPGPQDPDPQAPLRLIFGAAVTIVTAVAGLGGTIVRTSIHGCALLAALLPATWAMAQGAPQPQPPLEVTFEDLDGFPPRMPIGGVEHRQLFVYPSGIISFGERLPAGWADAPRPLVVGMGQIVAPLWSPMGGLCGREADEPVGRALNTVTVTADADGILVQWQEMTRLHEACHDDPETSSFSAYMSWVAGPVGPDELIDEVEVFRVVFDYTHDADGLSPGALPRAGVALGETAIELLPDEGKHRTDRAEALGRTGSGDVADGARVPGIWIIEVGADGELVGDDGDGIRSGDNCANVPNLSQRDLDGDGTGDACDDDVDGDGELARTDNCIRVANPRQADLDGDGRGDACDGDDDGDVVPDALDNCRRTPNPGQLDLDFDGVGDACDPDPDGDGVPTHASRLGASDRCPWFPDPAQSDRDGDGIGDPCDAMPAPNAFDADWLVDADSDGVLDRDDGCPFAQDPEQVDTDGDGTGDACDADADGDGKPDVIQGRCHSTPDGLRGDCALPIGVLARPGARRK